MSTLETAEFREPRTHRMFLAKSRKTVLAVCLVCLGVLMLLPIVWLVVQSMLGHGSALRVPPVWVTTHPTATNYREVPHLIPFFTFLLNSVRSEERRVGKECRL